MRTIKFRGKHINNGNWIYGSLVKYPDNLYFIFDESSLNSPDNYHVDPTTVGQFTGLTDKNGKEIYEGDVVKVLKGKESALKDIYEIKYYNAAFQLYGQCNDIPTAFVSYAKQSLDRGLYFDSIGEFIEIIGNLHDNPELIQK